MGMTSYLIPAHVSLLQQLLVLSPHERVCLIGMFSKVVRQPETASASGRPH